MGNIVEVLARQFLNNVAQPLLELLDTVWA
jgi:hypothetical protein